MYIKLKIPIEKQAYDSKHKKISYILSLFQLNHIYVHYFLSLTIDFLTKVYIIEDNISSCNTIKKYIFVNLSITQ